MNNNNSSNNQIKTTQNMNGWDIIFAISLDEVRKSINDAKLFTDFRFHNADKGENLSGHFLKAELRAADNNNTLIIDVHFPTLRAYSIF